MLVKRLCTGEKFFVTFVYARSSTVDRKELWQHFRQMEPSIQSPWVILGDFNSVLHANERFGGEPVTPSEIEDFA